MTICIETNGDIIIATTPAARIRLTQQEASDLGATLIELTKQQPAKARLMRYPIES
jgi:hypothetical protein